MKPNSLSASERLKSRKLIEQVFGDGKAIVVQPFRMGYKLSSGTAGVQAGFTVSTRNFKKAVDRNRIKRLMREAYRKQKSGLVNLSVEKNISLAIFLIYTGRELPDLTMVTEKLAAIIDKLMSRIDEKTFRNT